MICNHLQLNYSAKQLKFFRCLYILAVLVVDFNFSYSAAIYYDRDVNVVFILTFIEYATLINNIYRCIIFYSMENDKLMCNFVNKICLLYDVQTSV